MNELARPGRMDERDVPWIFFFRRKIMNPLSAVKFVESQNVPL